jgi:hypothetical protein
MVECDYSPKHYHSHNYTETIFCRQADCLAARGSHRIAGLVDTASMLREVQNRQVLASAKKKERNHDSAACSQVTEVTVI